MLLISRSLNFVISDRRTVYDDAKSSFKAVGETSFIQKLIFPVILLDSHDRCYTSLSRS